MQADIARGYLRLFGIGLITIGVVLTSQVILSLVNAGVTMQRMGGGMAGEVATQGVVAVLSQALWVIGGVSVVTMSGSLAKRVCDE